MRLGALPPSAARASELQYRNARLDEIRATGARFADTARLYQAMGTPPVDKGGPSGKAGDTNAAGDGAPGQQAHAATVDTAATYTPPSPQ
ncbi:RND efflux system, outer membrane lipoprotein, NodT family [Burkholderia sp. AU4i]|nr:RND efflux system, outer membrane lipoprotein, NodT family [Burkholderia sp. AU4i]